VQAILPVAHSAVSIELDSFTRQAPLAALDGGGHGVDAAAGDLAIGAATVKPFLGQLGGDGHNLQLQRRLAPVPSAAVRLPDGDGRGPAGLGVGGTPCSVRSD